MSKFDKIPVSTPRYDEIARRFQEITLSFQKITPGSQELTPEFQKKIQDNRIWAVAAFDVNPEAAIDLLAYYRTSSKVFSDMVILALDMQTELNNTSRDITSLAIDEAAIVGHKQGVGEIHRKNARKRHSDNYEMKKEVFVWLDVNWLRFKKIDKTAAEVIKQQPIAFTTAQRWIREWKKLKSASKL